MNTAGAVEFVPRCRVRFQHFPMSRDEANAFVGIVHRHAGPVVAHRFALRSKEALNRARVLLGGPDMAKHHRLCRLMGDGRVVCVASCPLAGSDT